MVYMNLQPPDGTARLSPAAWWSLTPPSHPYLLAKAVVFFCHIQPSPTACIFTSGVSYAARTFLSCHTDTSDRPGHYFPSAKVNNNLETAKNKVGKVKKEGRALCTALSFQLMIQNITGPSPIQLVVPNAVSAAVAAAMRIRSPISHRELLPFFIFTSFLS